MHRRLSLLLLAVSACGKSGPPPDRAAASAARIVSGLMPPVALVGAAPVRYTLAERMAHYQVPGLSIAVVDSGRLVWARGYGLKEAGGTDSVGPTTLFQAASISKPVAATAMLRLVEEGKLNLDQDVNAYLTSWKVPDSRFTTQHKVTLRRIVSHNAGLTVHGFPGYRATDSLPVLRQILDGKKPANTAPIRVDTTPGTLSRYSGGGTTVMQQIIMDVTGEPFATTVKRLVLDPAGMTASTYEQPLPAGRRAEAASAHEADGSVTPGNWHTYPEQAAAGLWTTPTDLVKWAMAIAASYQGAPNSLLGRDIAKEMLTVQKAPFGLGPELQGRGRALRFSHGGSNQGFRSEVLYFPELGKGAAVMTNGEQGSDLITEVLFAIAAEYGWPESAPRVITAVAMDSAAVDRALGTYELRGEAFSLVMELRREGPKLLGEIVGRGGPTELVFIDPAKLISLESGNEFTLVAGKDGRVAAIEVGGIRLVRKGP